LPGETVLNGKSGIEEPPGAIFVRQGKVQVVKLLLLLLTWIGRKTTTTTDSIGSIDASHQFEWNQQQQQQPEEQEQEQERLVGCWSEAAATALNESVVDGGSYGPACCPGKCRFFGLFFEGASTAGGFHSGKSFETFAELEGKKKERNSPAARLDCSW
jgi:hypothetical protein